MFSTILIAIPSLVAERIDDKPWKGELVTALYRRTPLAIWRRTPPPIFPNRDKNSSVEIPIWRRTPPPIFPNRDKNNSVEIPIWRRTPPPSIFPNRDKNNSVEIPIWRITPPPMFPNSDKNSSVEIPIWRRTPPPIIPSRVINNSEEIQRDDKIGNKSLNKADVRERLFRKWIVKDIYHLNKTDLARKREIKNMRRWILRWDLWDEKFKSGKHNRTDYLMYSRWRFLYEPPISNIIDFFKNL
uniref:Uncharacterized protein n=1 Tax=Meloidogyne enterolobii TaxID=390850 RepID=A0A6V7WAY5_MELEN|nr:unnamed protein product [Meloidogyne enterolobii]